MQKVQTMTLNSCDFCTMWISLLFCETMSAGYILVLMAVTQFT